MKKNGFTLTEVLVCVVLLTAFIMALFGASVLVNNLCRTSMVAYGLQRDAVSIMQQIADRDIAESSYVGLRSAVALINDPAHPTDLVFDGLDGNRRRYRVAGQSIIYMSPTIPGGQRTVYTAPNGGGITFNYTPNSASNTVTIDLILTRPILGRTISGSIRLVVPLKNVSF